MKNKLKILQIIFLIFIVSSGIYLKMNQFLLDINFLNVKEEWYWNVSDKIKILELISLIALILYCSIYRIKKKNNMLTVWDKAYLIWYGLDFLDCLFLGVDTQSMPYVGIFLSMLMTSMTYMQTSVISQLFIPYGLVLYIPMIYNWFIRNK